MCVAWLLSLATRKMRKSEFFFLIVHMISHVFFQCISSVDHYVKYPLVKEALRLAHCRHLLSCDTNVRKTAFFERRRSIKLDAVA